LTNWANAQHGFSATWAFEKVLDLLSLISNRKKAELQFFKYPCCLKLFLVSNNGMTTLSIHRDKFVWLLFIATVLLSATFAFANLSEFVAVGVLKHTVEYPFGGEGRAPWYYKTAQLYAAVNLIFGLLFLVLLSSATWAFLRLKKKALLASFILVLVINLIRLMSDKQRKWLLLT
jgi:hypothetical protein